MADDNPRPAKRVRIDSSPPPAFSSQSTLTPPPSSDPSSSPIKLKPLPPQILLLSLPSLLALPPNHRNYVQSLVLSLSALRRCLLVPALSPEIECRAWCGIAELGMRVISGGYSEDDHQPWARDIDLEVDKAISKAVSRLVTTGHEPHICDGTIIAQKHPSLRLFRLQLALLQAQLSQWQHKIKFARTQIRNLISSFQPSDPMHIIYSSHLAAIALYTTPQPPPSVSPSTPNTQGSVSPAYIHKAQDINAALAAVLDMESLSLKHKHPRISLLCHILRFRILVAAGMWKEVAETLMKVESVLGLSYDSANTPKPGQRPNVSPVEAKKPTKNDATFIFFEDPFEASMAVHTLMMSAIYFTHIGSAAEAAPRLSHLHALLDAGVLEKFPDGTVEAKLGDGPPLSIHVTHPRILFLLAFLVSSVSKRDAVGRKPKRKVFASEGVASWDNEVEQELILPMWASKGDIDEIEQRLARIKADLLCELIAVSTMRSEFDAAEENLNSLIAHTRTYSIFPNFAARISLHHAHLAHALDQTSRALSCYRVAAQLAGHDNFVRLSAEAGEMVLLLSFQTGKENSQSSPPEIAVDRKAALTTAKACRVMGGTLEAVGQIMEALVSPEILRAKEHLKHSLALVTKAQDNHLRAVVLALVAAHYFHTAGDHAFKMLQTCEQLATGLGAPPTKNPDTDDPGAVGNVRLGLWVGRKFLDLYKRANKEEHAQKQAAANRRLEDAVKRLTARAGAGEGGEISK